MTRLDGWCSLSVKPAKSVIPACHINVVTCSPRSRYPCFWCCRLMPKPSLLALVKFRRLVLGTKSALLRSEIDLWCLVSWGRWTLGDSLPLVIYSTRLKMKLLELEIKTSCIKPWRQKLHLLLSDAPPRTLTKHRFLTSSEGERAQRASASRGSKVHWLVVEGLEPNCDEVQLELLTPTAVSTPAIRPGQRGEGRRGRGADAHGETLNMLTVLLK